MQDSFATSTLDQRVIDRHVARAAVLRSQAFTKALRAVYTAPARMFDEKVVTDGKALSADIRSSNQRIA